jgi:cellulose synthase/poly-beta-1,6-N-acetylglucosamine synthase-like glycosyltransferase
MTDTSIWVGRLDLDDSQPVAAVAGPLSDRHSEARILIRMHRAPLGYVTVPAPPEDTLTERVRAAAQVELAESVQRHVQWDSADGRGDWAAQVACPRRFADLQHPGVTVVICTRDRTPGLEGCLRTVQQVACDSLEILVVDNAPTGHETRDLVTALAVDDPRLRYTCEPSPGLSRARNHGLAAAKFDLVAFTDDDTHVDPGWPLAIAAGFAADPEAVCITGLVGSSSLDTGSERYFDSRYSWGEAFEPRRYDLVAHRHPSGLYPFSAGIFGTGANFAVRRAAVDRLGGFDPLLGAGSPGRGGEDLDMFLRLILAGGRICYLPSAVVWHQHRSDTKALGEQIYSYGYGLGAYLAKHLRDGQLPVVLLSQGLRRVGVVLRRMRQASEAGQMRAEGRQLAWDEARGVLAGALCYYRASRRASRSPGSAEPRDG